MHRQIDIQINRYIKRYVDEKKRLVKIKIVDKETKWKALSGGKLETACENQATRNRLQCKYNS